MKKRRNLTKLILILFFLSQLSGFSLLFPKELDSVNLTSASNTLQTSRLSYSNVLAAGNTTGGTIVKVKTSGNPNNSTTGLFAGDSVTIGSNSYTVLNIIDTDEFSITSGLQSGDADENDPVYLKSYARHDADFTSYNSAVVNGAIRVYVSSTLNTSAASDTNPDGGDNAGFDFNNLHTSTPSKVTCPTAGSSTITFTDPVATRAGDTGGVSDYHTFLCSYSGTLSASDTLSNFYLGTASGADRMINPAPCSSSSNCGADHSAGTADIYTVKIELLDSMANGRRALADVTMKIGVIESVRVTATVEPVLNFSICGSDACSPAGECDPGDVIDSETVSTNTSSTATSVTLGTVGTSTPIIGCQRVDISTNAGSGYNLKAFDDGALRKASDDIDDVVTPPSAPIVFPGSGEDYGVHPYGSHANTTTWGTGGSGTNKYSGTDTTNQIELATTDAETDTTSTYILYKARTAITTAVGDYAHVITYVATAIF